MTKKLNLKKIVKAITIVGVFFCVVLSPTLRTCLHNISHNQKITEILDEEPNENEITGKELFNQERILLYCFKNNPFKNQLKNLYQCVFNVLKPYLKVNTPPPDFLLS